MRSLAATAALLAATATSCHTAMLRLERTGSAAIADASQVEYLTFFDGRHIPLPAAPFANCFDLLSPTLPANTCDQTLRGTRYRGYALNLVPRRGAGTPPWWLRDNRPSDLFEQLAVIRTAYARAAAPALVTIERDRSDRSAPSAGAADARTPRVTLSAEYTSTPAGIAEGDLLWLISPRSDAPERPWVYVGAVEKVAGSMRVLIPAPDTEVEQHWNTFQVANHLPRPVMSFIHASDAQIREPAAKLGGQVVSDTLDPLIPTFAHDYEQELFSAFFYESIIRTVNLEREAAFADRREPDPADASARLETLLAPHYRIPPELMIHTGDAVDAGLLSEFELFRSRSDLLTIPWFSVVGNHDVLGIGNLALEPQDDDWMKRHQVTGENDVACTPVTRMLREYFLERPTMNGDEGEQDARRRLRSKDEFSFAPIVLRAVCLDLDVTDTRGVVSDRFVGDRRSVLPDGRVEDRIQWSASPTSRFVEAHCRNRPDWTLGDPLHDCARHLRPPHGSCGSTPEHPNYPVRAEAGPLASSPRDASEARCSVLNGFDTEPPAVSEVHRDKWEWPGYYAFPVKDIVINGRLRPLWFVVLNTTSPEGAYGAIGRKDDRQLRWLRRKLDEIALGDGLVMVFAHHPIWGIASHDEQRDLKEVLFGAGNVIGYFAGHTHTPQLRVVEETCTKDGEPRCGTSARRIWEVVGPSTLEFPQQARQVTLVDVPGSGGLAYFEILPFSPQLGGEGRSYVDRAQASARRDHCAGNPSSCIDGEPRQYEQYLSYPRLWFRVPD